VLWRVVYLLTDNPCVALPWGHVNALKAPVLYSSVDTEAFQDDGGSGWNRTSQAPYHGEKDGPAYVRPEFNRKYRTLSWVNYTNRQKNPNGMSNPEGGITNSEQPKADPPKGGAPPAISPVASPGTGN